MADDVISARKDIMTIKNLEHASWKCLEERRTKDICHNDSGVSLLMLQLFGLLDPGRVKPLIQSVDSFALTLSANSS